MGRHGGKATWFQYDFSLTVPAAAPSPSGANYSDTNVAPLIESFAGILGLPASQLAFVYENNTPDNFDDDPVVTHPGDKQYLPAYLAAHAEQSPEMAKYEERAKNSARLQAFQDASPAGIEYFK
jgi:hypothetical protein